MLGVQNWRWHRGVDTGRCTRGKGRKGYQHSHVDLGDILASATLQSHYEFGEKQPLTGREPFHLAVVDEPQLALRGEQNIP